jgi:hypothetical protein
VDSAGSVAEGDAFTVGLGLGDAKATTDPYDTALSARTAGTVKNANLRWNLSI